jgi:accessory colonization factor AcfC
LRSAPSSKEPDAAKAFITYLKTQEAAAVFKAKGVKSG